MNQAESTPRYQNASALRQLAAAFYDGLLLLGILILAFALTVPLTSRGLIAIDSPLLGIYLALICFLFFGWFWTHGGRTLGMRVWHIKLVRHDGTRVSWVQALFRFLTALPGWGLMLFISIRLYLPPENKYDLLLFIISICWVIADHWKNSWRDRITRTKVIQT